MVAATTAPGPDVEPPTLVSVETQRCAQPNRFHGVGIVVGNDLVLTAGHTVEGDLRQLTVDGAPARVVTIDRRSDLALVSADSAEPDAHVEVARKVPSAATMLGPNATSTVEIDRAVTLVIEHATDRATYAATWSSSVQACPTARSGFLAEAPRRMI